MNMQRSIFRRPEGTGNDSEFWQKQTERAITHAVNVLHFAGYEITSQGIQDVILEAPTTANYKSLAGWRSNACNKVLEAAKQGAGTKFVEAHDCKLARDYFLVEWPSMAQQTRGSILVGIMATLTPMNTGIARQLFGTTSTTNPKEQIEGWSPSCSIRLSAGRIRDFVEGGQPRDETVMAKHSEYWGDSWLFGWAFGEDVAKLVAGRFSRSSSDG